MRTSWKHTDSIAGLVPGKNTSLIVEDGRIEAKRPIIIGTSGPNYLRQDDTVLCIENGCFQSTSDEMLFIGKGTTINVNGGLLRIGNTEAMFGCSIHCTNEITIGDGCGIGTGVVIRDGHPHTFTANDVDRSAGAPIVIEDGAVLPGYSIIKKGVTVGEGSVVASGSVVTDDIPPRSLAAGVPAEVVKTDVRWEF